MIQGYCQSFPYYNKPSSKRGIDSVWYENPIDCKGSYDPSCIPIGHLIELEWRIKAII